MLILCSVVAATNIAVKATEIPSEIPDDSIEEPAEEIIEHVDRIPITIEYGIIAGMTLEECVSDDMGNLYLEYEPHRQYYGYVSFYPEYQFLHLFVNGDEVCLEPSENGYVFSWSFSEMPSDVGFMAAGDLILVQDAETEVSDAVETVNPTDTPDEDEDQT